MSEHATEVERWRETGKPGRVFIADDHPIFRGGLRQLIESDPTLSVCGEASHGMEAIARVPVLDVDVALLDIDMPHADGFEVLRALRAAGWRAPAVFLTMHNDAQFLDAALDLGVDGYLVKDSAADEVIDCIHAVLSGARFISPQLAPLLAKRAERAQQLSPRAELNQLTATERKVLELLAQFKTNKEIAIALNIGVRTVEQHRLNVSEKFNLKGRHALAKFVSEHAAWLG
jgi:two-component system, NarL family, response regulator DegU